MKQQEISLEIFGCISIVDIVLYVYTLYATLPHTLIIEKLTELIEHTFNREGLLYLACNEKRAYFTSKIFKLRSRQKSL